MSDKTFGPTFPNKFPEEMRTQLWPLCCGIKVLSGFKKVHELTEEALREQIIERCDSWTPDFQVYKDEGMRPKVTFLTLNREQMASKKVMNAVLGAGFVQFMTVRSYSGRNGMFIRDLTKSFELTDVVPIDQPDEDGQSDLEEEDYDNGDQTPTI